METFDIILKNPLLAIILIAFTSFQLYASRAKRDDETASMQNRVTNSYMAAVDKRIADLESQRTAQTTEVDALRNQVTALKAQVSSLETKVHDLDTERAQLRADLEKVIRERDDLRIKNRELDKSATGALAQVALLQSQLEKFQSRSGGVG